MAVKQVIVMRKDLNMRKGKMCAQAAHASMAFITRRLKRNPFDAYGDRPNDKVVPLSDVEQEWLDNSFTKICVSVDSENELLAVAAAAQDAGLVNHLVLDNGTTEFNGVPTYTCLALGPDRAERIVAITGHLRLL